MKDKDPRVYSWDTREKLYFIISLFSFLFKFIITFLTNLLTSYVQLIFFINRNNVYHWLDLMVHISYIIGDVKKLWHYRVEFEFSAELIYG